VSLELGEGGRMAIPPEKFSCFTVLILTNEVSLELGEGGRMAIPPNKKF